MPEKVNTSRSSSTTPSGHTTSGNRRQGTTGKPIRFEDVRREGWYFKDLPQNVAEAILKRQPPGHFLVTQLGTVSIKLFLVTMRTVKNFDIETLESDGKSYYRIGKGLLFASIQQLVDHCKKSPALGIMLDKYPPKQVIDDLFALQLNEVKIVQPFDLRLPWDVRFGHWRKSDVIVQQCREHSSSSASSDDQKALFSRHSKILMAVKHENIAALLGCSLETSPKCFLVSESLGEGALIEYLHRNTMSLLLRPNDLLRISRDICKAMEYLESKRIVHNELAAENCVIDEVCRVKLTGFHLSRYEGDYESLMIPEYIYKVKTPPPEFYQNQFSCRSDVWSFGFLLWTVFKRGQDESFDIDRILNADWGTRLPISIISRARHLIASCLVESPQHRPPFKDILPFLHQENFPGPPYRFREYSSEEGAASTTSGEASQDDEPKAKITRVPQSSAKTKFPSMSNLADTSETDKPPPPPRNPYSRGETPTNAPPAVKPHRRANSALQAPISKLDVTATTEINNDGAYSRLRPHAAFKEQPKTAPDASPHRASSTDIKLSQSNNNYSNPNNNILSPKRSSSAQKIQTKQEKAPHIAAASSYSGVSNGACPHKTANAAPNQVVDKENANVASPRQQTNPHYLHTHSHQHHQSNRPLKSKPPPSPIRQVVSPTSQSISPNPNEDTKQNSKKTESSNRMSKSGSSTPVHITPLSSASSNSNSSQSNSQARFGYDRSTPKPDNRNHAVHNQASTITGSAINVRNSPVPENDEPSTFMEYDVSNASGYARIGSVLRNVRNDALQDEDIVALREMLDYATERIEFSEQARQDATREKNLIAAEISKTELKCMTEVEELSRMFFKHIQDVQNQMIETPQDGSANQNGRIDDDVKTKRLNEMKLRGRIAMRQLKQELKQTWSQNRDMMSKIIMLSHTSTASLPIQDRSLRVENSIDAASQSPVEQNTESQASSGEYYNSEQINQSTPSPVRPKNPNSGRGNQRASPNDLPESEAPSHVLEFLRKFMSTKDVSVLEKEQVKVLFKALDQAYNDQQKLRQAVESMNERSNEVSESTDAEKIARSAEQIQDYKNKVSKLKNKLATIMDENTQLRMKNENLQQIVQKANNVIENTREKVVERDHFEQKCQTLEQNLKRVETQMTDNEKNFRRNLVNLKQELKEALDGKKHFEREINNLLAEQQKNQIEMDQNRMMTKLQQLESERMEAEARAEALAENLKFLTTRMESQEMQIYHGKVTIESLRNEIESLQKQNKLENTSQYQSMLGQFQALEQKLQTAENKISEIVCERDQFKFLYELSLQKLRAQDEKPKQFSKAEKKAMKAAESAVNSSGEKVAPKRTSALNLLEKRFLNKGKSNSTQNIPTTSAPRAVVQARPLSNPAYVSSASGGFDSERTSLNSSGNVTTSSGAGTTSNGQNQSHNISQMTTASKMNQRPKLISPRIAKSPVPLPVSNGINQQPNQTSESITPLSAGKLKGKWQAL